MARLSTLQPRVQTLGKGSARPAGASGWVDPGRGSRHQRGYGSEWDRLVKLIRARDHDLCQECIRSRVLPVGLYSAVDHKVPRAEGGSDDPSNLEVICRPHHTAKTAREAGRGKTSGLR